VELHKCTLKVIQTTPIAYRARIHTHTTIPAAHCPSVYHSKLGSHMRREPATGSLTEPVTTFYTHGHSDTIVPSNIPSGAVTYEGDLLRER
jgi:hypothetical protein